MGWFAVYDMALPDHTNLLLFRMKKKVGSVGFLKKIISYFLFSTSYKNRSLEPWHRKINFNDIC